MLDPAPSHRRISRVRLMRWGSSIALIAAIVVFALPFTPPRSLRSRLLAAGPSRPTPGWLAAEGNYRPWRGPRFRDTDLARALAREDAATLANADTLDRAVFDLLRGETGRAVAGFELA